MAVHYNSVTREPYLRLPTPHSNIIITPHRLESLDETVISLTEMLNDSRVYTWLERMPYPYLREHGEEWVRANCKQYEEVLSVLRRQFEEDREPFNVRNRANDFPEEREYYGACPFTCIREVLTEDPKTGTPLQDTLIGDIKLARYTFYEHLHESKKREKAQRKNDELPPGDENIIWTIGEFLVPSHHGRGIMTLAMRTVIYDWGIPHMNVRHLRCYAFQGNEGSLRVFEKNNFEKVRTLLNWVPVPESRGGGRRSIVLVKWRGVANE